MCLCQHHPSSNWHGSPRRRRTLHHRGLQKLALNSGITRRSAKNASGPPKNPSHRHKPPLLKAEYLSLVRAGMSTTSGDEQNLGHFHPHDHRDVHNLVDCVMSTCRCTQRHVNHLVQELRRSSAVFSTTALGTCTGTTGTTNTLSVYCNCRISMVS